MRTDAERSRTLLWERVKDADDPDPEQRGWKVAHFEGLLAAAAAIELLDADEIADWRSALNGARPAGATGGDAQAHAHLEAIASAIEPLSRKSDPSAAEASRRFTAALEALTGVGLISDDEARRWRERVLKLEAPWLEPDDVAGVAAAKAFSIVEIGIPPQSPEEEAEDVRAQAEWRRLLLRGPARTVHLTETLRDEDGMTVVAVVTREEATEALPPCWRPRRRQRPLRELRVTARAGSPSAAPRGRPRHDLCRCLRDPGELKRDRRNTRSRAPARADRRLALHACSANHRPALHRHERHRTLEKHKHIKVSLSAR